MRNCKFSILKSNCCFGDGEKEKNSDRVRFDTAVRRPACRRRVAAFRERFARAAGRSCETCRVGGRSNQGRFDRRRQAESAGHHTAEPHEAHFQDALHVTPLRDGPWRPWSRQTCEAIGPRTGFHFEVRPLLKSRRFPDKFSRHAFQKQKDYEQDDCDDHEYQHEQSPVGHSVDRLTQ